MGNQRNGVRPQTAHQKPVSKPILTQSKSDLWFSPTEKSGSKKT